MVSSATTEASYGGAAARRSSCAMALRPKPPAWRALEITSYGISGKGELSIQVRDMSERNVAYWYEGPPRGPPRLFAHDLNIVFERFFLLFS
ncbi:unnamed protein product [Clonostachys rosea f. rosea IK726]|uniref:Uncharacterized protein n=1 Tax=Clonostachys rosea f. rosea IK726 TaxID=1349383 RepID=A0ACA9T7W2_BIOOC|nr:unnamed protein product [Clonostachys rosea f. rosea IK726]